MTTYTQEYVDDMLNKQVDHKRFMAKIQADNEAQTVKLLQSLKKHVQNGQQSLAIQLIDSLIDINSNN